MRSISKKYQPAIPVFSLIISILVGWLIAPLAVGFPMVAFFILFVGLSSLVYLVRREKTLFDTMLYIGVLLLSFFTIYRANGFLQFLDFLSIIFFGSLLVRSLSIGSGLINILLSPLIVIQNAFTAKNVFPYVFKIPAKYTKTTYFRSLPTISVTALILLITVPLLASANPFFNALLQNMLKFLDLSWLRFVFTDSLIEYILRFIVFATLIYTIPRIVTFSITENKSFALKQLFSVNYLIPKTVMAGLLIIFFITQIQLYFASAQTLQSMGYTNSRLTNEVFAQVTVVAFIVFLLAYFDKNRKEWNAKLTYLLVIEAFFLIGIAFKSVYDYSFLYGLTQKRLWGYTTMTWLTCALTAFIYHYRKRSPELRFVKQIITLTLGILLLVNILNFDLLIYRYAKPTTPAGVDYRYLSTLSADAHHYKDVLDRAMNEAEKADYDMYNEKILPASRVLAKIDLLRYKYGPRKNINTFNISEYQEYLATKDIDIEAYRKKISDTQQKNSSR